MRYMLTIVASAAAIALGGCSEEVEAPTAAEETPAFATAASLSFQQVSAGEFHTCGLTSTGLAYCWGSNSSGQLGDGTTAGRWRPVAVKGGQHFVQISAGGSHTCAVTSDKHAYCWGSGNHGQLGDGTFEDRLTPVLVPGRLFRMIRAGFEYTCGVTTTDAAFCWGRNAFGQLGTGGNLTTVPTRVLGGLLWKQVIAGVSHTCGVSQGNKGYCWGSNDFGQLGDGTRTRRTKPTLVTGGLSFLQVVPGGGSFTESAIPFVDDGHTCGLTTGNKAYCWGHADGGASGTAGGSLLTPAAVAGGRLFQNLNTGWQHSCGINLSDAAFCWGTGFLGDGAFRGNVVSPVRVSGGHLFDAVTTGTIGQHSCAWNNTDHKAWCWGENSEGQLGDGTNTDRSVPVAVVGP